MNDVIISGLVGSIHRNLHVREKGQGWTDVQTVMSLVLLNLAGGECVDDLNWLNANEGLGKLLMRCENQGLPRRVRRQVKNRWRKERDRSVASPSVARRYLSQFHDPLQEELREMGKAFIPKVTQNLLDLYRVNSEFLVGRAGHDAALGVQRRKRSCRLRAQAAALL